MPGISTETITADVVIVGAGLAGLSTALHLAPLKVVVLAKTPLGEGAASAWAQGGIAAAFGDDDSAAQHAADTQAVGGGIVDPEAARIVTMEAGEAVLALERHGVRFDRAAGGHFALGLEAGHSRRRILHIGGDGTGRAVMRGIIAAAREAGWIDIIEGAGATEILVEDGVAIGVAALRNGRPLTISASAIVLATGGIGRLYGRSTNPPTAGGDGLAMAARAGARLADLEFVQFHPTALDVGRDPMPLATEALRGEGAILVDERGERFMTAIHPRAELAPRDIVARAIWRHRQAGHATYLDCRQALGQSFAQRFPTVHGYCREAGIDPAASPIPIAPAEHYHMGGVATDLTGRSSVAGLWACGEAASTGLHGANRLASNSLLEGLVFARRIARDLLARDLRHPRPLIRKPIRHLADAPSHAGIALIGALRRLMDDWVGVVRNGEDLAAAIEKIDRMRADPGATDAVTINLLTVGRLIAVAASRRHESRGSHCRSDFPEADPRCEHRSFITLDEAEAVSGKAGPARRAAPADSGETRCRAAI